MEATLSRPENHQQFRDEQRASDGGWTTTIALVLAILFYIWLGAAIINMLAPVAGAQ
jgi:hypothetical protein